MAEHLDKLHAIDVDRTLIDTSEAFRQFVDLCIKQRLISHEALVAARTDVEASGGSFDVVDYLRKKETDEDAMADLFDAFTEETDPDDLVYPDAAAYLKRVAGKAVLVTYGGVDWQTAKIKAAGLGEMPYVVTPKKHKGELIASWRQQGSFVVPYGEDRTLTADTIDLIDDKASSFTGLPQDCGGYWIVRGTALLASQDGTVPPNVREITSLLDVPA